MLIRRLTCLKLWVVMVALLGGATPGWAFQVTAQFNANNSTSGLQAAINSGASTVIVPNVGQDWVVSPIQLRSNQTIIFEEGVVVTARPGAYTSTTAKMFRGTGLTNVNLIGYGATWRMDKSEFTSGEHRHALGVYSVDGLTVKGLTIQGSGGDGIYLGNARSDSLPTYNSNVQIEDVTVSDHRRQGISIISGSNVTIRNVTALNTSGTAPSAGLGLEPNRVDERLDNIVVDGFHSEGNAGSGLYLYLRYQDETSHPITVSMNRVTVVNSDRGLNYTGARNPPPNSQVTFTNSSVINTPGAGIYVSSNRNSSDAGLRFENITLEHTSLDPEHSDNPAPSPIVCHVRTTSTWGPHGQDLGQLELVNVRVVDIADRPYFTFVDGTGTATLSNVTGVVQVYNPYGLSALNQPIQVAASLNWIAFFGHDFGTGTFDPGDLAGQRGWTANVGDGAAQIVAGGSGDAPAAPSGDRLLQLTAGTQDATITRAIGPDPTGQPLHVSADLAFGQLSDEAMGLLRITDAGGDGPGVAFGWRMHEGQVRFTILDGEIYRDLDLDMAPESDTFYRFVAVIDPEGGTYDLLIRDLEGEELARVSDVAVHNGSGAYQQVTLGLFGGSAGDRLYVSHLLVAPHPIPEPGVTAAAAAFGVAGLLRRRRPAGGGRA